MKYKIHYGTGVVNLPEALLPRLADLDGDLLKVLFCLAAVKNPSKEKLTADTGCDALTVERALSYFEGAGILEITDAARKKNTPKSAVSDEPISPVTKPAPTPVTTVDSAADVTPAPVTLPRYSTEELVALLEKRRELAALVDECSRIFGKVFSTHETSLLLGIVDYLGVDSEYLLLLLAHCVKIGKKSVRYAEKLAFSLYDDGITSLPALQECLKKKEELNEMEGKIRTLFGISSRALTTKERKHIDTWLFTYHYGLDVITRAYEITVDAIGKSSVPYTNSILERWAAAGLHTLAEINAAEESRAAEGQAPSAPGNSFDTDAFFDAALKRSFGEDYEAGKK